MKKHSPFRSRISPVSALAIQPEKKVVRSYRGKKAQLDAFFAALRVAEVQHGLVVGLDRCANVSERGSIVARSYYLFVNSVCYRQGSIDEATAFLKGFCASRAASAGPVGVGDTPFESGRVQTVMGVGT